MVRNGGIKNSPFDRQVGEGQLSFKEGFFSMRLTIDGYDFALSFNIFELNILDLKGPFDSHS